MFGEFPTRGPYVNYNVRTANISHRDFYDENIFNTHFMLRLLTFTNIVIGYILDTFLYSVKLDIYPKFSLTVQGIIEDSVWAVILLELLLIKEPGIWVIDNTPREIIRFAKNI
jgi:hypothetical protein